ncbi:hypothetical protein E4U55_004106 [Claviceps digitariae]|nr:hypothetical protein E4U55_004106 [Claviceps digitariae]
MTDTTGMPLRQLQPIELISSSRHHMGLYLCVVLSCRYTCASSPGLSKITPALLHRALERLLLVQPVLRVGILDEDSNQARFCHIEKVHLAQHVSFTTLPGDWSRDREQSESESESESQRRYDEAIAAVHARHHNQRFEHIATRPAWRIEVVEPAGGVHGQDVVFAYHHALLDGTSGRMFHEQLLRELNRQIAHPPPPPHHRDQDDAVVTLTPTCPPTPQSLVYDSAPPSTLFLLKTLWSEFAPALLRPFAKTTPWHASNIDLSLPYVTRTARPLVVGPGLLARLLAACRRHGTSLTGLLHALTLASLAARLSASEAPSFRAATPISLRPFLPPQSQTPPPTQTQASPSLPLPLRDTLSVLVTTHIYHFSASQTALLRSHLPTTTTSSSVPETLTPTIWSLAHDQKAHLAARTRTLPKDDPTALLKYVSDWFGFFRKRDGRPRPESWELSNIGVFDVSAPPASAPPSPSPSSSEQQDTALPTPSSSDHDTAASAPPLSVSRVYFTNGAMPVGPPFGLGMASVPGGSLTIGLSWHEGAVSAELMAGLVDDLERYMRCFDETDCFDERR